MSIEPHELQITPSATQANTEPTQPTGPSRATTPPFEPVATQEPQPAPGAPEGRQAATLHFVGGVSNLTVSVDPTLTTRFAARFEGPQPEVSEFGNEITIRYPSLSWTWGRMEAEVRLHPAFAWTLRVRGGASRAGLDLRGLELHALEINGGVSRMDLELGELVGAVPVRILGGVSRLDISRPGAVPARIEVNGGASRLSLDDQNLGAIGGPARLQTSGFDAAGDRLQIEVRGGASRLTVRPR